MKFLFIHGLNSSSENSLVSHHLKENIKGLIAPSMPNNPVDWAPVIEKIITENENEWFTVIGNSTGGFFASWLANKYGFNLVLINPVVDYTDFFRFVGENHTFHDNTKWTFTNEDVNSLATFEVSSPKYGLPTLVFLGEEDDVLDHIKALNKYKNRAEVVLSDMGHRYILDDEEINRIKEMEFVIPFV